jgi:Chaperone of endosialidase
MKTSINRTPIWRGFLVLPLMLGCFALSPTARALLPPPAPDGGYPGANTAEGDSALFNLTTGMANTAIGNDALFSNTTGSSNTANGFAALFTNSSGSHNTANGVSALQENTTASNNTANGFSALLNNTTGSNNTADGVQALRNNNTGINNTASGMNALFSNTTGNFNTANGAHSLLNNTTGSSNIALGFNAGTNLTTGSNNIDIGTSGAGGEANTIRIGSAQVRTFIKGISGAVVSGAAVVVNAGGQLGVAASSARFKTEIKPMDKASEAILSLKPVTFRYRKEIDAERTPQFGLIAEQVADINADLVTRDSEGKPETVRYDQVNAMLLNEFLKEHRKVKSLEKAMVEQQKENAAMRAMLKEQAAQIQKVSAQLEVSEAAPQTVLNRQ